MWLSLSDSPLCLRYKRYTSFSQNWSHYIRSARLLIVRKAFICDQPVLGKPCRNIDAALAADDIPGDIIGMAHSILILCILHRIWAIRLFVAKTLPGNY